MPMLLMSWSAPRLPSLLLWAQTRGCSRVSVWSIEQAINGKGAYRQCFLGNPAELCVFQQISICPVCLDIGPGGLLCVWCD